FGLFYEIPVAAPWHARSERDAYHRVIDQAVLGEQVGFSHFWTVEHHFLSEFSHCSAPEVLYGAVAARTKTIRIGHGVRLLPFPYNHPIRAAEMAALLDCVCDGRLEFGTGRSATRDELEGFGIDPQETRGMWEEALEVIVGAWTTDVFSWERTHFRVRPRRVLPKPPPEHRADRLARRLAGGARARQLRVHARAGRAELERRHLRAARRHGRRHRGRPRDLHPEGQALPRGGL